MNLLDLLERVAPHIAEFPRWTRRLFLVTLVAVAASVVTYVAEHDSALRARAASAAARDVTVDVTGGAANAGSLSGVLAASGAASTAAVGFVTDETARGLSIAPVVPYLDLIRRGGPLRPGAFEGIDVGDLPLLDLKIANNSDRVVFLTSAVVDVASSIPDATAIPTVATPDSEPRVLYLGNEGWGPLAGAVLRYRVGPPQLAHAFVRPYPATARIGSVGANERAVGVASGLRAAGVDVAAIRRIEADAPAYGPRTAAQAAALRRATASLARGAVVYGELDYGTRTTGSAVVHRSVRIQVPILLVRPIPLTGAGGVSQGEVYNLALRPSGHDYRRVVGIAEELQPHEVDRFQIRVYAPRSSVHRLVVRLHYGAETVSTPPITIGVYAPRNQGPLELRARATLVEPK